MWPEKLTIIRYEDGGFSATQATPPEGAKFVQVYVPASALAGLRQALEEIATSDHAQDCGSRYASRDLPGGRFGCDCAVSIAKQALEAARDEALSVQKENKDVGK